MSEIKDKLEDTGETIKRGLKKSKNRMDEKADEFEDKKIELNKLLSYNVKVQHFLFLGIF